MITTLLARALAETGTARSLDVALARQEPDLPADGRLELAALLESYLAALPSAVDALTSLTRRSPARRGVAFVAGQALLYLVDEDDLVSEAEAGPLGLLDDAYLVYGCLAGLPQTFRGLTLPPSFVAPDPRAAAAARGLLPAGVAEALDATCRDLLRVAGALFAEAGNGAESPSGPSPALRVGEALALSGIRR